jgi:pilus assembly protein CpaF
MHDVFGFKQTGVSDGGVAQGHFYASGIRPKCLERLDVSGAHLPVEMFERRTFAA